MECLSADPGNKPQSRRSEGIGLLAEETVITKTLRGESKHVDQEAGVAIVQCARGELLVWRCSPGPAITSVGSDEQSKFCSE